MSSKRNEASENALKIAQRNAQSYYATAVPGLKTRMDSINQSLGVGEPAYMQQAYAGQRTGLTEGLAARGGAAQAQQMAGSKSALSGGNAFASLHPADIGAQLANALYGSKFQEGQANLNQQTNLLSMGLGGAGTAGNAALDASGNQLKAIGYMPNYNTTWANIAGAGALAGAGYGAYQNWLSGQPGLQPNAPAFGAQNYGSGFPAGLSGVGWGYSPPVTGSGPPSAGSGGW